MLHTIATELSFGCTDFCFLPLYNLSDNRHIEINFGKHVMFFVVPRLQRSVPAIQMVVSLDVMLLQRQQMPLRYRCYFVIVIVS